MPCVGWRHWAIQSLELPPSDRVSRAFERHGLCAGERQGRAIRCDTSICTGTDPQQATTHFSTCTCRRYLVLHALARRREPRDQRSEALDGLCGKVTRIGHSSSLVRMWVGQDVERAIERAIRASSLTTFTRSFTRARYQKVF